MQKTLDPDTTVRVYSILAVTHHASVSEEGARTMRIGELSRLTGASVRSLRYYEQQGLLISGRNGSSGYREYSPLAVEQVETILFYLKLGLSTEEIRSFLHCVLKNKEAFCKEVVPVYRKKLADLDRQIGLLQMIRSNLQERMAQITTENPRLLEAEKP